MTSAEVETGTGSGSPTDRWRLLSAGVPALLMVVHVAHYAVNVPYWDQWDFVPVIQRSFAGTLTLSDLFAQHNEHRIFFPRIITLVLASLTRWDVRAEVFLDAALDIVTFVLMCWLACRVVTGRWRVAATWAVGLFMFASTQWYNWIWGWEIQWYLELLAAAITCTALGLYARSVPAFAVGLVTALVATFSLASGMLLWPLGSVVIGFFWRSRSYLAGWALVGMAAIALYSRGYTQPPGHPPLSYGLTHPGEALAFGAAYIGSWAASSARFLTITRGVNVRPESVAAVVGVLGILALIGSTIGVRGQSAEKRRRSLPLVLIAWFVLATVALTDVGRVGFGVAEAVDSRYSTNALLFWAAVTPLVIQWIADRVALLRGSIRSWFLNGAIVAGVVLGVMYLVAYRIGLADLQGHSSRLSAALAGLQRPDQPLPPSTGLLYPLQPVLVERAQFLHQIGWGPYAPGQPYASVG